MDRDGVDKFYAASRRLLPSRPEWREAARVGERRAYLPVEVDGVLSPMQLTLTVYLNDPAYLVIQLVAPPPVCRLCLTGLHRNLASGIEVEGTHYHPWERNRPKGQRLHDRLSVLDESQPALASKDEAFAWFVHRNAIESPSWGAMDWPSNEGLL